MNKFKITDTVNYKKYGIVKKVLKRCLKMEGVHNSFFEVILVDNNTIQKINKEYRNIDRVTDVISFAFEDNDKEPKYNLKEKETKKDTKQQNNNNNDNINNKKKNKK